MNKEISDIQSTRQLAKGYFDTFLGNMKGRMTCEEVHLGLRDDCGRINCSNTPKIKVGRNYKTFKKMKTTILLTAITLVIGISCSEQVDEMKTDESKSHQVEVRSSNSKFNSSTLEFPEGTVFHEYSDRITFTLPDGFTLVGVNSEGVSKIGSGSGTITCECTKGTGCNPFTAGGRVGCELDGCIECIATKSDQYSNYEDFYILDQISYDQDFATINDVIGKRLMPIKLLEYQPISDAVDELIAFHSDSSYPLKVGIANIYGLAVIIELPLDPNYNGPLLKTNGNDNDDGGIKCGCMSSGSCPARSAKMGAIKYCDASNCSKCSLSFILVQDQDEVLVHVDENGYIR